MTAAAALLAALALGAGAPAAGQEPFPAPAFTLGEEAVGTQVEVSPGAVFAVELASASGGGYLWSVARADPAHLELVAEGTVPHAAGGERPPLGGPARQRFLFRALAPGAADLVLALARPWERDAPPSRTFTLRVAVAAPAD